MLIISVQAELLESTSQMGKMKATFNGLTKEMFVEMREKIIKLEHSILESEQAIIMKERQLHDNEKLLKETQKALLKSKLSALPDWEYIQSQFTPSIKIYWDLCKKMDYNDAIVSIIRESMKV